MTEQIKIKIIRLLYFFPPKVKKSRGLVQALPLTVDLSKPLFLSRAKFPICKLCVCVCLGAGGDPTAKERVWGSAQRRHFKKKKEDTLILLTNIRLH